MHSVQVVILVQAQDKPYAAMSSLFKDALFPRSLASYKVGWLAAGTTTATVLTRAIFSEGCKSVAAGMNPMDLRRGINAAVEAVVGNLKSRATMISTTSEIAQVRLDSELGIQISLIYHDLE